MWCPVLTFSFFSPPPKTNDIKNKINNQKMAATNKNSFWKIRVNTGETKNIEVKILA